jgi:hypothetical protein
MGKEFQLYQLYYPFTPNWNQIRLFCPKQINPRSTQSTSGRSSQMLALIAVSLILTSQSNASSMLAHLNSFPNYIVVPTLDSNSVIRPPVPPLPPQYKNCPTASCLWGCCLTHHPPLLHLGEVGRKPVLPLTPIDHPATNHPPVGGAWSPPAHWTRASGGGRGGPSACLLMCGSVDSRLSQTGWSGPGR